MIKRKSELKQNKIETVVETANEIAERRKQQNLEKLENKINKANKLKEDDALAMAQIRRMKAETALQKEKLKDAIRR